MVLSRDSHCTAIRARLDSNPAVAIVGARQVGKTTIARRIADEWPGGATYFDLERPADLARLQEPELALASIEGLVVLDEIQRRPDLFPVLRGLIDREPDRRFLVLGSAAPELLKQSSETLAGRLSYYDLTPFGAPELEAADRFDLDQLWLRGGFPRSYLAADEQASFQWRLDFIRTFVERDLPALGSQVASQTHDRFWRMLAHVHGQVWNGARFASSFGVAATTARGYLDLLSAALVVNQLKPWHEKVSKRQVKSPKAYIADSGLLHALLDLDDRTAVERHPILGQSWEGFVIDQLGRATGSRPDQRYFWATHAGAELDLLIVLGNERLGFEVKRTTSPRVTRSLTIARETLKLDRTYLVHAGPDTYPLSGEVEAVSAHDIASRLTW